jgi:hypothetical protein
MIDIKITQNIIKINPLEMRGFIFRPVLEYLKILEFDASELFEGF